MKIIFMGTPEFSVPSLKCLIEKHEVIGIFTQPDRPKGRGNKLTMSPVKELALKCDIPVYQPTRIKTDLDMISIIKDLQPDFIIVVAFGQILPKVILDIPRYGCINLHASLLPKFRGAAPINWAIINGELESGNTTMLMNEGLDTGDMLLSQRFRVTEKMNAGNLHDILMENGATLLLDTIDGVVKGNIVPTKQVNDESSYASMLNKELAKINWDDSAENINNLVRGLNPGPIAYTHYNEKVMKIYDSEVINEKHNLVPGHIIDVNKQGVKVATGHGILLIKILQFPGGKPLKVEEYIKGHAIENEIKLV
jgi:methionyl-tRNA formyltransferase